MPAPSETVVLKLVARRLETSGFAYMVTGSFALALYAQPRMTRDLDLVIALRAGDARRLEELFGGDFLLDRGEVERAIQVRGMFNLIHGAEVVKVDMIVRKDGNYRQIEFERRRVIQFEGQPVWVVAPEDLVLSKLVWAKEIRSEVQLRDVRGLLTSGLDLDRSYLEQWSAELGVTRLWQEVQGQ